MQKEAQNVSKFYLKRALLKIIIVKVGRGESTLVGSLFPAQYKREKTQARLVYVL